MRVESPDEDKNELRNAYTVVRWYARIDYRVVQIWIAALNGSLTAA